MREIAEKIQRKAIQKFNIEQITKLSESQKTNLSEELILMLKKIEIIKIQDMDQIKITPENLSSLQLKSQIHNILKKLNTNYNIEVHKQFEFKLANFFKKKYKHYQLRTTLEGESNNYIIDFSLTHSEKIKEIRLNKSDFEIVEKATFFIDNYDINKKLANQYISKTMTWIDESENILKCKELKKPTMENIDFFLKKNENVLKEYVAEKLLKFSECINNYNYVNKEICGYYIQQIYDTALLFGIV